MWWTDRTACSDTPVRILRTGIRTDGRESGVHIARTQWGRELRGGNRPHPYAWQATAPAESDERHSGNHRPRTEFIGKAVHALIIKTFGKRYISWHYMSFRRPKGGRISESFTLCYRDSSLTLWMTDCFNDFIAPKFGKNLVFEDFLYISTFFEITCIKSTI